MSSSKKVAHKVSLLHMNFQITLTRLVNQIFGNMIYSFLASICRPMSV